MYVSGFQQISGHIVLVETSTSSDGPAQAAFNRLKMGTHQGEEQAAPEMLVEKVLFAIKVGSRTNGCFHK